ncbi:DUF2490 domain-containing protein [Methylocucumis oryzae]|uniref:DUF2490 domain-containing protein n=1 Tax=Methylocucumis oryzae TaxID=1632867 RepID=A0A0F3IEN6_9GAMM|nr:DUF2490 domain-containing protein [Methylocucumis oryzae]KJV05127.1 hypothetical protein VZ94_20460 [Methylocucumis oryzae]
MKRSLVLFICFSLPFVPVADATDDRQTWVSSTYQTDFGGSRYLAFLELAPRFNQDSSEFNQFIIRPLLGYKITPKLQLWLGYTWQGEYSDNNGVGFDNATHDLMQQVQWIENISPALNLQYRFRLEQRFFADADSGHRMRHRLRLQYTLPGTQAYLIGIDELFIYLNSLNYSSRESFVQPGLNQNRAYAGIGYKFSPHFNVDTGYQLQYVNNFKGSDTYNSIWFTNVNFNF